MPKIDVKIQATKTTTRDGSHPDDEMYRRQITDVLTLKLEDMGFIHSEVTVRFIESD